MVVFLSALHAMHAGLMTRVLRESDLYALSNLLTRKGASHSPLLLTALTASVRGQRSMPQSGTRINVSTGLRVVAPRDDSLD